MAFSFFGSASNPAHNGTNTASPAAVTPPGSMQSGDLVVLMGTTKDNFADVGYSISTTGGQTWNTTDITGIDVGTNRSMLVAWCIFNGTWAANPAISATVSQALSAVMIVARPDAGETVAFDTHTGVQNFAAPSSPFDVTLTGLNTATADEFVIAVTMSVDDNELVVQTVGWTSLSFDNAGGTDLAVGVGHKTQALAGATGSIVVRETANGGDAGLGFVAAWQAAPAGATNLVIQDATHSHAADNLALTQVHNLVVADALHAHTADNLALTISTSLAIQEALHGHTADNVALTQVHILAIADALHAHAADNLALTQVHILAIQEALHAHATDGLTLTQVHNLAIQEALHAQAADNVVLGTTSAADLVIQDALHGHTADGLTLTQAHQLSIADAIHSQVADPLVLTQVHNLVIQDALHAHLGDNVALSVPAAPGGEDDDVIRMRRFHRLWTGS